MELVLQMELDVEYGASRRCRTLLGMPSATLLNKLPQKMELVKKLKRRNVGNAPKGLSSEFHPIRSHTDTTLIYKTANGTDPLVR